MTKKELVAELASYPGDTPIKIDIGGHLQDIEVVPMRLNADGKYDPNGEIDGIVISVSDES
jgi:hypothetical protein